MFGSKKTPEQKAAAKAAIAAHKNARRHLDDVYERMCKAGIRDETDEYCEANSAVLETEKNVPWWRR